MEIRSVEVRSFDAETRTITGVIAPYNQTIEVGGIRERFVPGVFSDAKNAKAKVFYGHNHRNGEMPIGRVSKLWEDREVGTMASLVLSETSSANDVYRLLQDGVLDSFSVGFEPVKDRVEEGVIVRESGNLLEVSVVPFPAYSNAAVTQVRSEDADNLNTKENEMSNDSTAPEVAEIREAVSDLERKFEVMASAATPATATRSIHPGEFLKALAAGDESARMEIRAVANATTTGDLGTALAPSWVNDNMRIVVEQRDVVNLFQKEALPATGMTLSYATVTGTAGTVGEQVLETDDLPYMEVTLGSASAPVKTYGGYSRLSRQAIERSDVSILASTLFYQAQQYAKATNAAVRTALVGATGTNTATFNIAAAKASDWINLVIDAAGAVEDNSKGSKAEFLLMSRLNFKKLYALLDTTNRPVFDINNDGTNTFGNLTVTAQALKGVLAGVPVIVVPGIADTEMYVAASDAVKTWETPGAPFRLQDENIINLSKDFSLYGYLAVGVQNPLAVTKVTVTLV